MLGISVRRAMNGALGILAYNSIPDTFSRFFMDQRDALSFDDLTKIGAGLEFDISKAGMPGQRVRIQDRYLFGDHVSGASMRLAISF